MIAEKIDKIKEIQQQQQTLEYKLGELAKPLLHNLDYIPAIYGWFCEFLNKMDFPPDVNSVIQRKKFLVIIIFLYSPASFSGKWMLWGLRKKLSETLGITSRTTISDNCADAIAFYNIVPSYRQEIEEIYQHIYNNLLAKGWVGEELQITN